MKVATLALTVALAGCTAQGSPRPQPAHLSLNSPGISASRPECPPQPPDEEIGGAEFTLPDAPTERLVAAIAGSGGPTLPIQGPMSAAHICGGYASAGDVLLRFDHGAELYYFATDLDSEEAFVRQARLEFPNPEGPLKIVAFRDTKAAMIERNDRGQAVIFWLEGASELELYGSPAARLSDLMPLGEALVAPDSP